MVDFPEITFDFLPRDLEGFMKVRNTDLFRDPQETVNCFWGNVIEHLREIVRKNRDKMWAGVMKIHQNTAQVTYGMNSRTYGGTWDIGVDAALQREAAVIAEKGWQGIEITHTFAAKNIAQLTMFNAMQLDALLDERRELAEAGLISPVSTSQSRREDRQPVRTEDFATPVPSALPILQ